MDEPDMPAFSLGVTEDDLDHFRANLYRYLHITLRASGRLSELSGSARNLRSRE